MAEQLGFALPAIPALGREDFLVAPSNALAVALIDSWPNWQAGKLLVTGPKASGKTHLAHVWASRSDATLIAAQDVTEDRIPTLAEGNVAIEDVQLIAGNKGAETALFHLHNLTLANGHTLLLTGSETLAAWPLSLPDLKSRLQGAAHAQLAAPDDTLLAAILAKLFADRQLVPPANVIEYLVARMDRSFSSAYDAVDKLDRASLAQKRSITRTFAAQTLDFS